MEDQELLIDRVMKRLEIPAALTEKLRPRARQKGEPRCERQHLLDIFLARLNASRVVAGYSKLTYGRIAKVLEGIPTDDLYAFYKKCETYNFFGAGFWHELKSRV